MKKLITCTLAIFLCSASLFAQEVTLKEYVKQGIALHDKGDYKAAIETYRKALQLDPKSALVNYEIASSYFSLKQYDEALRHVELTLQSETDLADHAYILKGSVLDLQGKSGEAIAVYKTALKSHKDNHLLYYNLALTLYNNRGAITEITDALEHALKLQPAHTSSHLLLGHTMLSQGKRVQALLALYNALLLEPEGSRAQGALSIILEQLQLGVERKDEQTINITLSGNAVDDEFGAAETMLSLTEASKTLEKNKEKTEHELFIMHTESLFDLLAATRQEHKGFWWEFYVAFFASMKDAGQIETFCNYIWVSKNNVKVNRWLEGNTAKIERLSKWYDGYKR